MLSSFCTMYRSAGDAGWNSSPAFFLSGGERSNSPYINHFLSPDSIVPGPYSAQSLNRYSYVVNNPINAIDPTGHLCIGEPEECLQDNGTRGSGFTGTGGTVSNPGARSCSGAGCDGIDGAPEESEDEGPLSQTSQAMFDEFESYCQANYFACGDPKWPFLLNPFKDVDSDWLALYESEIYSVYGAQGIDLDSIVGQNLDNPLNMQGQQGTMIQMYQHTKSNPVYNHFLKNLGLDPTRPANLEVYYLVKMIRKNPDVFRKAIIQCGPWCIGRTGRL